MKKRLLTLFVAIVSVFGLSACGESKKPQKSPEEQQEQVTEDVKYTFGFSCITMDNPYFIALESVIRENVEAQGHQLVTFDAESDTELQDAVQVALSDID